MGSFLEKLFLDPTTLPGGVNCTAAIGSDYCEGSGYGFVQVLMLMVFYGYILFASSNLISDGSELLLLIPSIRGIVGSVVLPILGAVPDGAIVLFSGLGADAQNQVSVGVGALAGSTIMLLTLPWFLAILGGRVDVGPNGPIYKRPRGMKVWKKLTRTGFSALRKTGVSLGSEIRVTAKIMFATSIVYFVIQGPAFFYDKSDNAIKSQSSHEKDWAIAGFALTLLAFIGYLIYQVKFANIDDAVDKVTKKAISERLISLSGAFASELSDADEDEGKPLVSKKEAKVKDFLRSFFEKYDYDNSNSIDSNEFTLLMNDLNERLSGPQLKQMMSEMDKDNNGSLDFDEFSSAMIHFIEGASIEDPVSVTSLTVQSNEAGVTTEGEEDVEDEEEEDEEMPEEFQHLSPKKQRRAVLIRSIWTMGLGTFLVLLFSDPMVGVLNDIGTRMGVPPFYVAFVLAPLASNASELIAAFNYAKKKTRKTIAISLATLEGAAVMNNTFCLAIFLLLIFFEGLAWRFSAETISIVLIQVAMTIYAHKRTHTLLDGIIIVSFYPISLVLVALIEGPGGLD
eukprot:m.64162 g.64162  ORF g.64162 m.64162 type:complete len:567 (+) comp8104_c0_seq4:25-1725(+)